MSRFARVVIVVLTLAGAMFLGGRWFLSTYDDREPSRLTFMEACADCHGARLEGSETGPALVGRVLAHGATTPELVRSIREQHEYLPPEVSGPMVKALALFVSERRQSLPSIVDSHRHAIPDGPVRTQHHEFTVERVTELSSGPYSIEPMPDGRILVSEKVRGLSVVDAAGAQGDLVEGTPEVWREIIHIRGSYVGLGQMLDVELHPDYASTGWVYISHADRCQLDCGTPWPKSMVRVVRGRLVENQWVDQEVVWSVHTDNYTVVPDGVAGGRLAFDAAGDLYITVGGKSTYDNLHVMDTPYGKIHRVHDDGTVPDDNPFWLPDSERLQTSARNTVYTYGHRTTQGLATNPSTGLIWSTEMGPRGGDEINKVVAGGNYGWPLYTNGLDYDATPISIGQDLGLDFALSETILPVVDFTPAPSLSNFTFHQGDQFPGWENDLLVGSLRAQTLFRIRLAGDEGQRLLPKVRESLREVLSGYAGDNGVWAPSSTWFVSALNPA